LKIMGQGHTANDGPVSSRRADQRDISVFAASCFALVCENAEKGDRSMRRRDIIAFFGSLPFCNVLGFWRRAEALPGSPASDHLAQTAAAIADVMFPGDGLPAASTLGVQNSVIEMKDFQAAITTGVAWLDRWAASQNAPDFLALDEARRLAAIDAAFASQSDGIQQFVLAMRFYLGRAYYSQPSVKAAFAYTGPPQPEGFADFQEPPA
jgi:hypothetical protein